ncbi:hypothetical protein H351_32410 (plasmid) [Rhodococcus erythropolis R138]|uniref:pentapeptide repeat-containing protein n=1 Tax=Rhodococcus erythropolis TaxID=1833 RepID=UPI0004A8767C|nr:pentapeptide repeat-containing protein [Rhodococcus erythropolis]ALU73768.1 hypothetical protein H351_32410 [Rhodococcus erythropolis R138]
MIILFAGTGLVYGLLASGLFLLFLSAVDSPHGFATLSIALIIVALTIGSAILGAVIGVLARQRGWLGKLHRLPVGMTSVQIFRGFIVAAALFLIFAVAIGGKYLHSHWADFQQPQAQPQAVLGAGLCAVLAASLAFIAAAANAVETSANRVQTHSREVERALHDRYVEAAAQLGDSEATFAKRVGGAYALAAVADDWLAYDSNRTFEAEVAVDLMCAYLRANTTDRDFRAEGDELERRGEESVRASLIVLLREHTYLAEIRKKEKKSGRPWPSPHVSFNLDGADLTSVEWMDLKLHDIQLVDADLTDADLSRSQLVDADLTGATLIDAVFVDVDLTRSVLTGATLTNCDLRGADLSEAMLEPGRLTEVYSGRSPSGKTTIWPEGIAEPPPRDPSAEAITSEARPPS